MDPGKEMNVVTSPAEASGGISNFDKESRKEYLELAMRGEFAAFQDEMGKHPLGITAGVDIYEDRSALHMAALHAKIEIVSLILSTPEVSSQIVNARDRFGYTPLHLAVRAQHEDVVRILAKSTHTRILAACGGSSSSGSSSQQDEKGQDCDGFTPLHLAAVSGNIAIMKLLLQEFACREQPVNIHATSWKGTTALDIAKHRRDLKLVDILESCDVKWLQLERQKSANSVNATLVGAALVATVTFERLLDPPPSVGRNDAMSRKFYQVNANLGFFLVCTALAFSSSIVSLVIGTTAVIPSSGVSLKREVQQLRRSVLRASISLFVAIFFLLWASQVGGFVVAGDAAGEVVVYIILVGLPIIVLAFVLRHIVLPEVKVKVKNWVVVLFFVVAVGLNIGIYVGLYFAQKDMSTYIDYGY